MERPVDEFGFFLDSKDANPVSNVKNKTKETEWLLFLEARTWNQTQLKKMCRQGIPDSLRAQVWMKLANADSQRKDGLYKEYLAKAETSLDQNTKDVIARDLARTFPNHIMFNNPTGQGITNLKCVLTAYAAYNPTVGYCQGMGMVVGILLMRMSAEDAFYLFVAIVDRYMTDYYSPDLSQLRQDGMVFDHLLHKNLKKVARKLDQIGIDPLIYLTQWFMPIYTVSLPWRAVLRVWDIFFCDGVKSLHRIALGIMYLSQNYIIQSGNSNSEVLNFLLHIPKNMISPDELIEASLKFRITKVDIEQIRSKIKESDKPRPQSSKLPGKPRFPFDRHFLFPKILTKSKDALIKNGSSKADLSVTSGHVFEVIDTTTTVSNVRLQSKTKIQSDWALNDGKLRELRKTTIHKSMDVNFDHKLDSHESTKHSIEDYASSSNHSSDFIL